MLSQLGVSWERKSSAINYYVGKERKSTLSDKSRHVVLALFA